MAKEKEKELSSSNCKTAMPLWSFCADMKLLLATLFFLCSLATVLQLLPTFQSAAFDLRSCLISSSSPPPLLIHASLPLAANLSGSRTDPHYHPVKKEEATAAGGNASFAVTKRAFNPVGSAAYLFVQMGAYRGGPASFAVVGLASKPIHVFAKPQFLCEWIPHGHAAAPSANLTVPGTKILPDWGYGRVYTVVVVNCTFPASVGANGSGGRLVLRASASGGYDQASEVEERIEALVEDPGSVDFGVFVAPPKYDYLYCGSSLYGNLSPQRVREWLAYHVRLFGPRSHFVIHDAGGVHPEVAEVLRPWMEKGYVTLQDIREQERFDGYYHNQFLVVNDCLHRYRHDAKWIFFFDVDEFIYISPERSFDSVLAELKGVTQFTIEQRPMSYKLCLTRDLSRYPRMWGLEKLVFRDVKRGIRRDRKYAIQPRNAFATGVHMSQNIVGKSLHKTDRWIKYFHYHGMINDRHDPCKEFVDVSNLTYEGTPYVLDTTLRLLAGSIKKFELETIGPRLQRTRQ